MRIKDWLAPARVAVAEAVTKQDALDQAMGLLHGNPRIADMDGFRRAVWEREEVLPTGIGLGIGVPHVRSACVRDNVAAMVLLREGVDYGSIDGMPVRLLLLIAMPEGTHSTYLEYLATATRRFQDAECRERLFACRSAEELWAFIEAC